MFDPAIPWGSLLSTAAEWHYFAGGLCLGFPIGLYAEHWARERADQDDVEEGNDP